MEKKSHSQLLEDAYFALLPPVRNAEAASPAAHRIADLLSDYAKQRDKNKYACNPKKLKGDIETVLDTAPDRDDVLNYVGRSSGDDLLRRAVKLGVFEAVSVLAQNRSQDAKNLALMLLPLEEQPMNGRYLTYKSGIALMKAGADINATPPYAQFNIENRNETPLLYFIRKAPTNQPLPSMAKGARPDEDYFWDQVDILKHHNRRGSILSYLAQNGNLTTDNGAMGVLHKIEQIPAKADFNSLLQFDKTMKKLTARIRVDADKGLYGGYRSQAREIISEQRNSLMAAVNRVQESYRETPGLTAKLQKKKKTPTVSKTATIPTDEKIIAPVNPTPKRDRTWEKKKRQNRDMTPSSAHMRTAPITGTDELGLFIEPTFDADGIPLKPFTFDEPQPQNKTVARQPATPKPGEMIAPDLPGFWGGKGQRS